MFGSKQACTFYVLTYDKVVGATYGTYYKCKEALCSNITVSLVL